MNECECSVNFNYSHVPLIFLTLYLGSKCTNIIVKREFFNSPQKLFKKINLSTNHDRKLNTHQNVFVHPLKSLEFQCI